MADLPEDGAALLLDMLLAARNARGFVADLTEVAFRASRLHQYTVIRSLDVIGEAPGKVSPPTRVAYPNIPWHRLIHGYADIRLEPVLMVTQERIGPLIEALVALVPDMDGTAP